MQEQRLKEKITH